jgi:hypothetical protein
MSEQQDLDAINRSDEQREDIKREADEYEPYGPEWVKELMKWSKPQLIRMLREALIGKSST